MKDSDFIGKKFNLKKTSSVISGKFIGSMEIVSYELDDPEMEKALKDAYGNVRIIAPNTMVTADFVPTRANVHLSINGVIEEITKG
jgi:hypothetical protein